MVVGWEYRVREKGDEEMRLTIVARTSGFFLFPASL